MASNLEEKMICICDTDGLRYAEEHRIAVCKMLGVPPADLSLKVVQSIRQDFKAELRCDSDQWFGVGFHVEGLSAEKPHYIECDLPLDGYVWAFERLASLLPDRAPTPGPHAIDETVHARLFAAYSEAEVETEAHRKSCGYCGTEEVIERWPDGRRKSIRILKCPTGERLSDLRGDAYTALHDAWGMPDGETPDGAQWWGEQTEASKEFDRAMAAQFEPPR